MRDREREREREKEKEGKGREFGGGRGGGDKRKAQGIFLYTGYCGPNFYLYVVLCDEVRQSDTHSPTLSY